MGTAGRPSGTAGKGRGRRRGTGTREGGGSTGTRDPERAAAGIGSGGQTPVPVVDTQALELHEESGRSGLLRFPALSWVGDGGTVHAYV